MSSTDVRPVHDLTDRADYLECGVGEKKRTHKTAGTDRLAVMFCSTGTIDSFVERGLALAEQHGRTVQAQSYLQNFERVEFDVDKTEDLLRVNDLGFMLAQRMHPNSDVLVVTHDDAEGGHAHNHVIVLNHDNETGLGLKKYRTHGSVKKVNDALMREQGLRTVTDRQREIALGLEPGGSVEATPTLDLEAELRGGMRETQATYWARKHGQLAADEPSWDERLGDAVATTMLADGVTDTESLAERLSAVEVEDAPTDQQGILLVTGQNGGTTFEMWDPELGSRRRRSASKLSPRFTKSGREKFFGEKAAASVVQPTRIESVAEQYARAMARMDTSWIDAEVDISSIYPDALPHVPLVESEPIARAQTIEPARDTEPDRETDKDSASVSPAVGTTLPDTQDPTVALAVAAEDVPADDTPADSGECRSQLRTLQGGEEQEQRRLDLLVELDETYAALLLGGASADRHFEKLATRAGVGRALLDGRVGQRLHPAVHADLEKREVAKSAKNGLFEWAKEVDGDEFMARMALRRRAGDLIKDGQYETAARLRPTGQISPVFEEPELGLSDELSL